MLSSRQNFETWQESGSLDAARRANATWKRMLTEYQRPPLDPAIEEALTDYVARRKVEIGRAA
jgi:trimethylamine--corrinoid protein Co-methyltransferase